MEMERMAMQFNSTTDYAIRTVVFLAIQGKITTSAKIANRTAIPRNYQLKVMEPLVREGILQRIQGVKGGFCLGREATNITLYDIIRTIEKTVHISRCMDDEDCCSLHATAYCPVRSLYERIEVDLEHHLKEVTIDTLVTELTKRNSLCFHKAQ
jgi:Rrf2 family protein